MHLTYLGNHWLGALITYPKGDEDIHQLYWSNGKDSHQLPKCKKKMSWDRHDIESLSTLLILCKGNPLVTSGLPSQRTRNLELWFFFFLLAHTSCWANSGVAGNLKCHDAHLMSLLCIGFRARICRCGCIVPYIMVMLSFNSVNYHHGKSWKNIEGSIMSLLVAYWRALYKCGQQYDSHLCQSQWPVACHCLGIKVRAGHVFCLLLRVSSGCARPITGQVKSVTWPVIGWA